ncbi:MAG: tRNA pseudouridine(38-40) synthase TruA [Phycisphaerales bacterium JB043]
MGDVARYRLTIAYDGTCFHGWQKQDVPLDHPSSSHAIGDAFGEAGDERVPIRTVQHVVEQGVRQVVRQPIELIGASRTDAGVHALGQCAAFTCSEDVPRAPDERLARAINDRLPEDVLVTSCERTRDDFDPIRDCESKAYRYTLCAQRERPLWDRRYVTHTRHVLDVDAMRKGAAFLVGEHDFASFAAAGHGRESTVRTILSCQVSGECPGHVMIDVSGTGFLYNMVRIIAGTLLEVGRGRLDGGDIPSVLEARDRARSGPTLGPEGLRLEWIRYPGDLDQTRG